ncbi:streptococcal hemagglutinin-like isoform X2 [Carassius carassius]|uniref:streptococcal hemagglutinin-like isoform X2 n=1 Tax=Carassius carassius TaxID=217509 RepID=UPI00286961DC|nr:streptococcal hemagglutinin-like isoform X2 [Carassius carassius]
MTATVQLLYLFLAFCPVSEGIRLNCPFPFLNQNAHLGSGKPCATMQLQTNLSCPSVNLSVSENVRLDPAKWHLESLSLKVEKTCSFMVFQQDKESQHFPGGFYSNIDINSIITQKEFLCICPKLHNRYKRAPRAHDFNKKHLVDSPKSPCDTDYWKEKWDDAMNYRKKCANKNTEFHEPETQSFMARQDLSDISKIFTRDLKYEIKGHNNKAHNNILYRSMNKMYIYDVKLENGVPKVCQRCDYVVAGLDNNGKPVHYQAVTKHIAEQFPQENMETERTLKKIDAPKELKSASMTLSDMPEIEGCMTEDKDDVTEDKDDVTEVKDDVTKVKDIATKFQSGAGKYVVAGGVVAGGVVAGTIMSVAGGGATAAGAGVAGGGATAAGGGVVEGGVAAAGGGVVEGGVAAAGGGVVEGGVAAAGGGVAGGVMNAAGAGVAGGVMTAAGAGVAGGVVVAAGSVAANGVVTVVREKTTMTTHTTATGEETIMTTTTPAVGEETTMTTPTTAVREETTVTTPTTAVREETTVTTPTTAVGEDTTITTSTTTVGEETTMTTTMTAVREETTVTIPTIAVGEETTLTTTTTAVREETIVTSTATVVREETTMTTTMTADKEETIVTTTVTAVEEETPKTGIKSSKGALIFIEFFLYPLHRIFSYPFF